VHTTQFAIRRTAHDMYRTVLALAAETAGDALRSSPRPFVKVAGICGHTPQALREAAIAAGLGYDIGLVSLGEWRTEPEDCLLVHCREIGEVIPIFGFYLQPAVGGRILSYRFWRELAEIAQVWAVKIAPFNRYQTIDVVRAVADAGRDDIALYTGNDDNIIADLLTPYPVEVRGARLTRWIDGGLLGQWAVWTHEAVQMLEKLKAVRSSAAIDIGWLRHAAALTDANGAIFDAENGFAGCVPGIHEVLRRQGLLRGIWCLDPAETLSPGQAAEIDRVCRSYPTLADDAYVERNLAEWLQ
jgi:dihydrodipicolinate synthase/N-acetylneuraminate lyase